MPKFIFINGVAINVNNISLFRVSDEENCVIFNMTSGESFKIFSAEDEDVQEVFDQLVDMINDLTCTNENNIIN